MDTKALKKQMGAAIAMVLVAAVALGSATFAWFVSNNKVTAQTSNIAAQSNSAYLVIDKTTTSTNSTSSTSYSTDQTTGLYPAMIEKKGRQGRLEDRLRGKGQCHDDEDRERF